jgi:regulation of enolase protein 1 (concanavalin A-like superfamily)
MQINKKLFLSTLLVTVLMLSFTFSLVSAAPAFIDEFTGASLQSFWVASGKTGSTFDLTTTPGSLTITSPINTDLGGVTDDAPKVIQTVSGDFEATTKVTGDFTVSGSHAGLVVYVDNLHFMRLERRDGQKIQLGGKDGGDFIYGQYTLPSQVNPTYLKLVKTDTTTSGYWSADGITWNLLSWTEPFTGSGQVYVGLFVINQFASSFPAVFDYFHIAPDGLSVLPESPLLAIALPIAVIGAFAVYRLKPLNRILRQTQ